VNVVAEEDGKIISFWHPEIIIIPRCYHESFLYHLVFDGFMDAEKKIEKHQKGHFIA
jgi:lysophospholipid acyltransferase (LPLAT)-like uncharacterized protein